MWTVDPAKIITAEQKAEAERQSLCESINPRIIAGKVINGIHVTGRDEDSRNPTNLAFAAQIRTAAGDTTTPKTFRDGDNVDHELTLPELMSLWQQSSEYVSALDAASWALKALDSSPADFADDIYWPA